MRRTLIPGRSGAAVSGLPSSFDAPDWPEEGRRPLAKHGLGLVVLLMSGVYFAAFIQGRLT